MARRSALALGLLIASTTLLGADPPSPLAAAGSQYQVVHPPRVQLGDAPLASFAGARWDRATIIWQTIGGQPSGKDSFELDWREVGSGSWKGAGPVVKDDLGLNTRTVHFVDLDGLAYGRTYEYRVRHLRAGSPEAIYPGRFATRLAPGNLSPFTFVAYGDAVRSEDPAAFRAVQARINELDPAFALLLGDNAYSDGSYSDYDHRLDPLHSPEATEWTAGHVDYVAFGNHDIRTDGGAPTERLFAVPVPSAGADAPAAPPPSERAEHNYSFDYGSAHFLTFDTNAHDDPVRLDALLRWAEADLTASNAPWKIVYGHHPVAGAPDKSHAPGDDYFRQVVPRLLEAGVDLFLVGHSHTFGWTYPLTGFDGGAASYVSDIDGDFAKGAGLVQVIAGTGGAGLRSGAFGDFGFVASGFSTTTDPRSEHGVARIDVAADRLTVSYVAADDGAVLGAFSISASSFPGHGVGLVDPARGRWLLRDSSGGAETGFYYGDPGDVPVVGDWDCDGIETVGLLRLSEAFFYLRNANTAGPADLALFAGNPDDVPLAGDFDGDGCGELALYRPSTQRFFVYRHLPPDGGALGAAPIELLFGDPGDVPVVGDFDGNGVDDLGLYRPGSGFFYWRLTLSTGIADGRMFFGDPQDRPVAGDWGFLDELDTPAVFRPSDTTFYFRHTLTQGVADAQFTWPGAGSDWVPVAGKFGL